MGKGKERQTNDSTGSKKKSEKQIQKSGIWEDQRFQHLVEDPRFRQLPKSQRKVKIDKRFQSMFTDPKFNVKYTVDKYGRRVNSSAAEDLRKYYELNSSASEDDDDDKEAAEQRKEEKAISRKSDASAESSDEVNTEIDQNDTLPPDAEEEKPMTLRDRLLDPDLDYARGQCRLVTDSSDDDSTEEEEEPELELEHVWGELDNDAETTDESTRRIAVCNMDWDRIRAIDLMMLFSSFVPPGGSVLSVKIYPSEYGKQRMAEEEKHGPQELVGHDQNEKPGKTRKDSSNTDSEEELVQEQDSDDEEGDEYHMEKLRQYQLNRLRYFYAVVECDCVRTADKIYQECDGLEYESSATRIDLRFIPDDTLFDEDEPSDVCTELPDTGYQPRQFTTTALQQAKVDLTWDETAVERREMGDKLMTGKLEEVNDADLRKLVAYSSEEEVDGDDNEHTNQDGKQPVDLLNSSEQLKHPSKEEVKKNKKEDSIAKYKALLAEINEQEQKGKEKKYEMEVTWEINSKEGSEKSDEAESDLESNAKKTSLTPIEKVLLKRSEKNKRRKEERKKKRREALGLDPNESDSDSESVPDGIDMNDPYFAEEFSNGDFIKKKTKNQKKQKPKLVADDELQKEKELQLLLDDDDVAEQGKQHFSLAKIQEAENETKSKRKRKKMLKKSKSAIAAERKEVEDNFQININDRRFGALYSSHLFNIDPTDSHFKKTKGMERIIHEKLKRRHGDVANEIVAVNNNNKQAIEDVTSIEPKRPKKELENKLLVKSLKRKIEMKHI